MITFSSIQLRRSAQILLDNASAVINPGQKVGLVGKNGCGKSTLLALIKNELQLDAGSTSVPAHWDIAWVNQETPALERSAIDYVIDGDIIYRKWEQALNDANEKDDGHQIANIHHQLSLIDAWTIESRAAKLLNGLGFSQSQLLHSVKSFSGGWRMRLNLAQALIRRSDLLLLDEPTNHLDLDAVLWLEKWLQNYDGTLILISHDRDFLDPLVNKIIHIEQQKLQEYTGNYSDFEQQRASKLLQQQSQFELQQQKIAHLQSYIDRFKAKASKAKQAQSRVKMLEKMEKVAPALVDNPFYFTFKPSDFLPSPLLTMKQVQASYGDVTILEQIKLNLVPGSRIGLLGKNGAGKSTLIKLLSGEIEPKTGELYLAKGVKLGYFAQHQLDYLRSDESPLWHLNQISNNKETEQSLRNYLGGFDFRGDKVNEPVKHFSGGEKARLVLALIVWQRPNLLLLDEPTNHLDLDMRQALTEALMDFDGAMVVVSHDRHLLRSTTDEFYLVHDKKVEPFDGDLDDYHKWLNHQNKQASEPNKTEQKSAVSSKKNSLSLQEKQLIKQREAEQRAKLQPLKKEAAKLEKQLDEYHAKLKFIEHELSHPSIYDADQSALLTDYLKQQGELKNIVEQIEAQWLDLQDEIDNSN